LQSDATILQLRSLQISKAPAFAACSVAAFAHP